MYLYEKVKAGVTVQDAARQYGLPVNRNGMARCVFHDDRTPSMKLNDHYFYCFGCGTHGDVIDLTARLCGLSSNEAAQRLAADFSIADTGQTTPMTTKTGSEAQQLRDRERLCFSVLRNRYWLLRDWKERYAPKSPEKPVDDRFTEACHQLDYAEYLLDEFLTSGGEERRKLTDELHSGERLIQRKNQLQEEEIIHDRKKDEAIL